MPILKNKNNEKTLLNDEAKTEIKNTIKESLEKTDNEQEYNYKDVETVKIIINELGENEELLPATTNLTTKQVHGIAKLRTLNLIFKSPMIDEYIFNIEELKRSETKEPFSMLKGLFDLANNQSRTIDNSENTGIARFLGFKGRR